MKGNTPSHGSRLSCTFLPFVYAMKMKQGSSAHDCGFVGLRSRVRQATLAASQPHACGFILALYIIRCKLPPETDKDGLKCKTLLKDVLQGENKSLIKKEAILTTCQSLCGKNEYYTIYLPFNR